MTKTEKITPGVKELYKAISQLQTTNEVGNFMRDLCTRAELETMAERWQIVAYLEQKLSYRTIAEKTGASTATITRVAQWLHHGMGGYKLMLNRSSRSHLAKASEHRRQAKKSTKAVA